MFPTARYVDRILRMKATQVGARWQIVFLWQAGHSKRSIAKQLGVSLKTVCKWTSRHKASGGVSVLPKTGRPTLLSVKAKQRALELLLNEELSGAYAVALQLHLEGLTTKVVSKDTIIRACTALAKKLGTPIHCVRGKPAKRLTQATKTKRLNFCLANRNRTWSHVMFSDRKRFLFSYPGAKVKPVTWLYRGQPRQAATVNHPMSFNVYVGITRDGVTACQPVTGSSNQTTRFFNKLGHPARNITSEEYKHVLMAGLLPEGQRLFDKAPTSRKPTIWTFQQDNDPTHKVAARVMKVWSTQHGHKVQLLEGWPPNSPDLNPIENLWAYVQGRVNRLGCKSYATFKQAVLDELAAVPLKVLSNLYASMPRRIEEVIAKQGDKISC